jgi:hypothetical protein
MFGGDKFTYIFSLFYKEMAPRRVSIEKTLERNAEKLIECCYSRSFRYAKRFVLLGFTHRFYPADR